MIKWIYKIKSTSRLDIKNPIDFTCISDGILKICLKLYNLYVCVDVLKRTLVKSKHNFNLSFKVFTKAT